MNALWMSLAFLPKGFCILGKLGLLAGSLWIIGLVLLWIFIYKRGATKMKVFIVYAHPGGEVSFTRDALENFTRGLTDAGHSYVISDLYKMNFQADFSEAENFRETKLRLDLPVPADVLVEQEKVNSSDAIVFVYPLFWADVPAKMKGWFDRVWTYGFAYGDNRTMKVLEKGLVLCVAGNTKKHIEDCGQLEAAKLTMLQDRLFDRVKSKQLIIMDGTSKFDMPLREASVDIHREIAYNAGLNFSNPE
jgi:NAD(P)H dehydrogenase (quinone)